MQLKKKQVLFPVITLILTLAIFEVLLLPTKGLVFKEAVYENTETVWPNYQELIKNGGSCR